MTESTRILPELGDPDGTDGEVIDLRKFVTLAVGAASTCWDNLRGAGVFDDAKANRIVDEIMESLTSALLIPSPPVGTKIEQARRDLARVLNRYSIDNDCGTPDFILALMLTDTLATYQKARDANNAWHS